MISKIRYGLHMFLSTKRTDWSALENVNAKDWFRKWDGERAYDVLWKRLFDLKFFEFADNISAAWIWTRIKRVGTSRASMFQEELGYIDGGSQTLVDALVEAIAKRGGSLKLGARVSECHQRARPRHGSRRWRHRASLRCRHLDRADTVRVQTGTGAAS